MNTMVDTYLHKDKIAEIHVWSTAVLTYIRSTKEAMLAAIPLPNC